jgi:hypothetical protein
MTESVGGGASRRCGHWCASNRQRSLGPGQLGRGDAGGHAAADAYCQGYTGRQMEQVQALQRPHNATLVSRQEVVVG